MGVGRLENGCDSSGKYWQRRNRLLLCATRIAEVCRGTGPVMKIQRIFRGGSDSRSTFCRGVVPNRVLNKWSVQPLIVYTRVLKMNQQHRALVHNPSKLQGTLSIRKVCTGARPPRAHPIGSPDCPWHRAAASSQSLVLYRAQSL